MYNFFFFDNRALVMSLKPIQNPLILLLRGQVKLGQAQGFANVIAGV